MTRRDTVEPGRRDEVERRPVLALEPVGGRRPGHQIAGRRDRAAGRAAEFEPLLAEHNKNALGGRGQGGKFKLRAAGHGNSVLRIGQAARLRQRAGFSDAIKLRKSRRLRSVGAPAGRQHASPDLRAVPDRSRRFGRHATDPVAGLTLVTARSPEGGCGASGGLRLWPRCNASELTFCCA